MGASGYEVIKVVAERALVEACRVAMRGEPFHIRGRRPRRFATT